MPKSGDPAAGKTVFQRCAICHKVDKGAGNGVGPNLFGVVGRKSASLPDFEYSGPLKASGITWTDDNLIQMGFRSCQDGSRAPRWRFPASPAKARSATWSPIWTL